MLMTSMLKPATCDIEVLLPPIHWVPDTKTTGRFHRQLRHAAQVAVSNEIVKAIVATTSEYCTWEFWHANKPSWHALVTPSTDLMRSQLRSHTSKADPQEWEPAFDLLVAGTGFEPATSGL